MQWQLFVLPQNKYGFILFLVIFMEELGLCIRGILMIYF